MEKDLMEIESKVAEFCKKYGCTLEVNTLSQGRNADGEIILVKVCSKIQT